MKILLIGANGQLGTDLKKILNSEGLCPPKSVLDITQFEKVKKYFEIPTCQE